MRYQHQKVRATYIEANSEQVEELLAESVARVCESADLRLVGGDGGREGLLGFPIDEFAKVEGPLHGELILFTWDI